MRILSHLEYLHRIPTQLYVNLSVDQPNKIMAARKHALDIVPRSNSLVLKWPGYPSTTRISMFDHLTPRLQNLLYEAKRFKTTKGYKFCWARNNQIYLRKSDYTGVIRIKTLQVLANLNENKFLT
jgi:hypothetical protein